ncbi:MAG TPA: hypothetical protein VIM79_18280 [Niastella sp.]
MPQYVVHKIGFQYNDNAFEVGEARGNIMGISSSLEEAKLLKHLEDIATIQRMAGKTINIFFRGKRNYEEILEKLAVFYKKFNLRYPYAEGKECVPPNINEKDAAELLSIIEVSFHNVMEYNDDEVIHPEAFELNKNDFYWE